MSTTALRTLRLIRRIRPWGGETTDLLIGPDGRIERLGDIPADGIDPAQVIDGRGLLALPGLVNAHAHVDKSWWGMPWETYGGEGSTDGRIRHERERRDALGIPGVRPTAAVLAEMVKHGTTAIRSHVDVDLGVGLRGIEAVREAASAYDGALDVQIVAFPQDGVLRRPGVLDLLRQAARAGAEHIGGLDPAGIDRDPVGQIDAILGLAAEEGVGVDIHLHDPAELGAFQFELIADRTVALGLQGRVTIAHGFALAQLPDGPRLDLIARLGEAGVSMTTVAPIRLPQLPVAELDAAGVPLGFGTDGIRDLWSPYGTGDTLGIGWQFARASSLVRDEDLTRVVRGLTSEGAWSVGRTAAEHDLVVGGRADVVLLDAENPMDALVRTPPREVVVAGGRALVG
ncbi:amidohydrolase family protein [Cellulomonas denverensis]|uniref:Amidohydrolase family protein n=1 Tax=Cellulomonas denverensis TaxID=264297 RepID=A0A7X6KTW6_9CELL|nr:amidohydrolase family protein [Cellulomonas denverensis]NKY22005.1 amidohydrolase family protein [Cellulomonas denverensis]GIG24102.1 cytosine deaminase [Cellulomonas denverensis]